MTPLPKGRLQRFATSAILLLRVAVQRAYIVLPLLAMLYGALFENFRPDDLDNPWFLSFSYNMCNEHVDTDQFEQVRFPNGMDGTHLFGKLAASTQCLALNRSRWLPRDASWLNILFVVASLALWWAALRRLRFSPVFVGWYVFLLGVWEPVVNMAGQFRYEFFAFFLMSAAVWLAATRLSVLSITIAFLAGRSPEVEYVCHCSRGAGAAAAARGLGLLWLLKVAMRFAGNDPFCKFPGDLSICSPTDIFEKRVIDGGSFRHC